MITPLRRQYLDIKKRFPDVLLLFRLGDFYETFDDDARIAASVLGIVLTSREMGKGERVPMAGIPYHAVDTYLGKLIAAGHKVAICEQTSDPDASKGLVDRDVVRVVTPGTVVEPNLLDQKANNYLAAVVVENGVAGLAHVDITTSEFAVTQLAVEGLAVELQRLAPAEVLVLSSTETPPGLANVAVTKLDARAFDRDSARERLLKHFGVVTLEAYGCDGLDLAIRAAGAVLVYLADTQKAAVAQITSLSTYSTIAFMALDPQTRRNLELLQGGRWGATDHSLLKVLDTTKTAMGARLLRRWLSQPLLTRAAIEQRLDAVQWLYDHPIPRGKAMALVAKIADLERLCNRVRSNIAGPKEVVALRRSLELVPGLRAVLEPGFLPSPHVRGERHPDEVAGERGVPLEPVASRLRPCRETVDVIAAGLADDPPAVLADGDVIRAGFSAELDELRSVTRDARSYLANLERRERERSGIKSLKVGYNRVFGYYIEVSNANKAQVPGDYVRKQTLVGGERYITPELKEHESVVLNAQERMQELESSLFRQVCHQVAAGAEQLLTTGAAVAEVDLFAALAEVAVRNHYVRPQLSDGDELEIVAGRHPVVERNLALGTFVPNDSKMSCGDAQLILLTGPNMAGKSTYLRQVGLIVFMAQIGSFVPADSVRMGIVDRIFTRVGLQDDLATGQSTFMVEMVETAQILNNATPRSLIILDEIGRGTSTYDGLAIARAVAEFIHNHPKLGAKTLFATHYHELTELARYLPRARNYHVAVAEEDGRIVFLHKIVPGGADKSYGVHVAQLAGLPKPVVSRAQEVLESLEHGDPKGMAQRARASRPAPSREQLALFPRRGDVLLDLLKLDVASLTPLEAITKLFELQEKAKKEGV
ncbi:MAG: DNA mismatch repair protein MutS [Chloroflexi bacterium]|nr:DNA mismatch repair protein MutS [Chloroflexota bacterium]